MQINSLFCKPGCETGRDGGDGSDGARWDLAVHRGHHARKR
jgi:hypothetical protein